jgi:hypothetical protein
MIGIRAFCALLALCLMVVSRPAPAQGDAERAGARAAAGEGFKAFSESRWSEALDLFTRAESLVHAPTHLLYIARSQEKLGQLVRARETYQKLVREKLAATAPDAFRQAQESGKQELAQLEPRVAHVTIQVTGEGAKGASVTIDGEPIPPGLIGVPYPVDPGEHTFLATGEGVQSEAAKITIAESARQTVELELKPAPGASAGGGDTPGGGSEGGDSSVALDSAGLDKGNGMRIGAYAALGVGVVGLAAGTFFLLQSSSKRSEADDLCPGTCPESKRAEVMKLDDDADSAATLGTVGLIVGGVGVAAGVTLLILSSGSSEKGAVGVRPWVGLGSAGISGNF